MVENRDRQKRKIRPSSLLPLGLALAITASALPASAVAAALGLSSSCTAVTPKRFQCDFAAFPHAIEIEYASMQCGSTGAASFSLQNVQLITTPPGSLYEVAYQIPITNRPSLAGVVTAGSPMKLFQKGGQGFRGLIDLDPAPAPNTSQCTFSISVEHGLEAGPFSQ